jgi:alpha-galactosidase
LLLLIVDALVSTGLRDLGYNYVNIDDCWQSAVRRTNDSTVQPDPTRFPSGMKALGDYIHANGMHFGIYSSAGFKTCQAFPASLGMEQTDVSQYVEWGVDYLKYDNCYEDKGSPQQRFPQMASALKASGRDIYFSMCEW